MALDKTRELLEIQAGFGGFDNTNSVKLILAEVSRGHGQEAVDALIHECRFDEIIFGFVPEMCFDGGLAIQPEKNKN